MFFSVKKIIVFFLIIYLLPAISQTGLCQTNQDPIMNIAINTNAPVVERQELFINASPERVWNVLATIEQWPQWQQAVSQAQLEDPLAEGSVFIWKAGGIRFTSKLHTVQEPNYLGWTGKTIGASAIHNWTLQAQENGTIVKVEESLQGFLPFLFKRKFQKELSTGMSRNLQELKTAAEKDS